MDELCIQNDRKNGFSRRRRAKSAAAYLMLAPQIIGFLVFSFYPILWAAQKAWFYYTGAPFDTRFVSFENFRRVFAEDAVYWRTWLTTLKFAAFKLPVEIPLALVLAVILNGRVKGKSFFRSVYFLPHIISIAIVGLIFSNMFDYFGIVNSWLIKLGLIEREISWFETTGRSMSVLVTSGVWATFGINVLYFVAALSNVPEELYEAAVIDGAGTVRKFFNITLPMIAPVFQTILLLSLNGTLQTNEAVLVTTGGAPGGTTYTVMSYQVSKFVPGFVTETVNIGYGCAMSIVTSLILCSIALIYSKASERLQDIY